MKKLRNYNVEFKVSAEVRAVDIKDAHVEAAQISLLISKVYGVRPKVEILKVEFSDEED